MLNFSLFFNAVFAIGIFFVLIRTRAKIIDEKRATFAGCLAAITRGLVVDDPAKRMEVIGRALASLKAGKDDDADVVTYYLTRASFLNGFRQVVPADLSEHLKLLALDVADSDDEMGSKIIDYISTWQTGKAELHSVFNDKELAAANFVAERKILDVYARQITSRNDSTVSSAKTALV